MHRIPLQVLAAWVGPSICQNCDNHAMRLSPNLHVVLTSIRDKVMMQLVSDASSAPSITPALSTHALISLTPVMLHPTVEPLRLPPRSLRPVTLDDSLSHTPLHPLASDVPPSLATRFSVPDPIIE